MGAARVFQHWMTRMGVATARPASFVILAAYGLAWVIFDARTLDWHSIATLAT
jgi:hypothetical protein